MSDLKMVVEQKARALFAHGHWLRKEETVAAFDALGNDHGFMVSGEGCGDGEWLYDLSWSDTAKRNGGGYYLVGQPLVLESEERTDSVAISKNWFRPKLISGYGSQKYIRSSPSRDTSRKPRSKSDGLQGRSQRTPICS